VVLLELTCSKTEEQPQRFVNEQRSDGTFRWKFVMDPSLTQQDTEEDLGMMLCCKMADEALTF
jgi:hypothetical protein